MPKQEEEQAAETFLSDRKQMIRLVGECTVQKAENGMFVLSFSEGKKKETFSFMLTQGMSLRIAQTFTDELLKVSDSAKQKLH